MEVMDAKTARNRCLEALCELEDVEDQRALWKAAAKYNRLANEIEASTALENAGSPLAAHCRGSGQDRDW